MKIINSDNDYKRHLQSLFILFPILVVLIGLQYAPPTIESFVYGGTNVIIYNLLEFIFVFLFPIFLIALGCIYLSLFHKSIDSDNRSFFWIFSFFIGAGLLTIIGFLMGLMKLLFAWIAIPFFVLVFFFFLVSPYSKKLFVDFRNWICAEEYHNTTKILAILIRIITIVTIVMIVISKGILLELFKDGGLHQYFGYFAETRLNHSTWMDPNHPIIYDYLMGRGQGIYLFITSFTNQYTIQLVGVIFLLSIGVLSRQFIHILIKNSINENERTTILHLFPDIAFVLIITSPIIQMESARFHLETGAFFLFLLFVSSLFSICKKEKRNFLLFCQIPILIAFPITSPIFLGFILFTSFLSAVTSFVQKRRDVLWLSLKSMIIASISSTFSLLLNWIYVGLPEIQPYPIFRHFILPDRLKYWSSEELMYYLNSAMNIVVTRSNISFDRVLKKVFSLFSYPINTFADSKLFDINFEYLYSILMFILVLWLLFKQYRMKNLQNKKPQSSDSIFIYWLSFESCYLLKIAMESTIQQSSLGRMLLFMNILPIITFFSIIILFRRSMSPKTQIEKATFSK